jgi:hypothetical protein
MTEEKSEEPSGNVELTDKDIEFIKKRLRELGYL